MPPMNQMPPHMMPGHMPPHMMPGGGPPSFPPPGQSQQPIEIIDVDERSQEEDERPRDYERSKHRRSKHSRDRSRSRYGSTINEVVILTSLLWCFKLYTCSCSSSGVYLSIFLFGSWFLVACILRFRSFCIVIILKCYKSLSLR